MTVLLLDDERSFIDDREHILARTVEEAIEATDSLTVIDELWLDYILLRGDTLPFLQYLRERKEAGNPVKVHKLYFHSSSNSAISLVKIYAAEAGIPEDDFVLVDGFRRVNILK